ncbi:ATP-binding protein [Mycolicibacterium iranicum]|uniref:AAA+ ATPase domain-containing protein n=1 Tax=Mycolicibacterium iranicum TaxID=912594 RepID=A0A178LS08_MYCIR|nr:ATP-binding protein [Mycolicibacterium iranicum]OAN36778.1 hypothetical protein A4X20_06170 [Mycolicibacterium iranicum]
MTGGNGGGRTFLPGLASSDPCADGWLRQATLRLRREVAWRWHQSGASPSSPGVPPAAAERNPLVESLDLTRHWDAQQAFFETDETGRYLCDLIAESPPTPAEDPPRGSFSWVLRELRLNDVSAFALALGLLARLDGASGPVFAACAGDGDPTLALVQRLWDEHEAVLRLADMTHPLWRTGLLQQPTSTAAGVEWETGYGVPPLIASTLLFPADPLPSVLSEIASGGEELQGISALVDRLRVPVSRVRVVPVKAAPKTPARAAVAQVAAAANRRVCWLPSSGLTVLENAALLQSVLTLAWLADVDLFLREASGPTGGAERAHIVAAARVLDGVAVTLFLHAEPAVIAALPADLVLPLLEVPKLTYEQRIRRWRTSLGAKADGLDHDIRECARRYRFEADTIDAIAAGLAAHCDTIAREDLYAACQSEAHLDAGDLAQQVSPRFAADELILPPAQVRQLDEIEQAMRSLTEVHYSWGTAKAWNESGISVLFAGPSGTGKTMAAEVLATKLQIPMYRVNLAQVVDKYIGETEKNLERIFDAADMVETILFFDEADALFGKRTEVKDAHDRYANLEVSYLLERMERFKGLAILATNRRGDLDQAFLRRLRYIVEFPMPDVRERRRIWERVVPKGVDGSQLDFDFLARQFQLTGGNIRSAMFNACLQTAAAPAVTRADRPTLDMDQVVIAVKREYEKLQRTVSRSQFGPYADKLEALEHA